MTHKLIPYTRDCVMASLYYSENRVIILPSKESTVSFVVTFKLTINITAFNLRFKKLFVTEF